MEPFLRSLFATFMNQLDLYLENIFPALMNSFGNFGRAFVVLYIIIVGFCIMKGWSGEKTKEFLVSLILLPVVWGFIFEGSSVYNSWIVTPIVKTTLNLSSFFIGGVQDSNFTAGAGLGDLFSNLDSLSHDIFNLLLKTKPSGNFMTNAWVYIQVGVLATFLFAAYVAVCGVFVFLIIMGFFSMYVFFIVGGICIFFVSFAKTRHIFYGWLKGIANFSLIIIFTSIIMAICYSGMQDSINQLLELKGANRLFSPQYLGVICWCIFTFGVLLKGADYASTLTGDMSGSTAAIAAGVGKVAGIAGAVAGGGLMAGAAAGGQGGAALAKMGVSKGGQMASGGITRAYSAMKGVINQKPKQGE